MKVPRSARNFHPSERGLTAQELPVEETVEHVVRHDLQ